MAKAKSKFLMVVLRSLITNHKVVGIRPRLNEKLEVLRWDPQIQQMCVYKETEKLKSAKR